MDEYTSQADIQKVQKIFSHVNVPGRPVPTRGARGIASDHLQGTVRTDAARMSVNGGNPKSSTAHFTIGSRRVSVSRQSTDGNQRFPMPAFSGMG